MSHYDTNPDHVNAPYSNAPLSTRHNLVWFADNVSHADLEGVETTLRDARLSFNDRRNISTDAAKEKRARLKELLAEIQAGSFGPFAAQNHTVSYNVVGSEHELVGVLISRAFQLPVERADAQRLIVEMNSYRLENCSED